MLNISTLSGGLVINNIPCRKPFDTGNIMEPFSESQKEGMEEVYSRITYSCFFVEEFWWHPPHFWSMIKECFLGGSWSDHPPPCLVPWWIVFFSKGGIFGGSFDEFDHHFLSSFGRMYFWHCFQIFLSKSKEGVIYIYIYVDILWRMNKAITKLLILLMESGKQLVDFFHQ